jgi:hypothetical protein
MAELEGGKFPGHYLGARIIMEKRPNHHSISSPRTAVFPATKKLHPALDF